ncbi:tyrosine-type recombinase/integrase [Shewanella indica]|uniref:tyrosine-type recombinase/integrase n=1 Tax=Shewanella indica TaxID=768528 RepID=UPI00399C3B86
MTQLIHSSNVYKQTELTLREDGTYHCLPTKDSIGSLPTLFSNNGTFLQEPNSYFFYLKVIKKAKDLNPCCRALLKYYQFLEDEQLAWDHFPPIKRLKPTYLFRSYLLKLVKHDELAHSTANTYINQVKNFYLWTIHEGYLRIEREQEAPFKMEFVQVKNKGMLAHLRPTFTVETSDLRIKVPKNSDSKTVRPLSPLCRDSLNQLTTCLPLVSEELRLQVLLSIDTGLRIKEVSTFTLNALDSAKSIAESKHRFEILLCPRKTGVQTKFSKPRTIEISSNLLQALNQYRISERRLQRANKLYKKIEQLKDKPQSTKQEKVNVLLQSKCHEPLFISQQGNPVSSGTIEARWTELRAKIKEIDSSFEHRFHDLRATYGTYRLYDLLEAKIPAGDCMELLMGWMGHNSENVTWKYLRYLKRKDAFKVKFGILDSIMHEALGVTDE